MLVIHRRRGESVRIGEDVEVEILELAGQQVKLGIRAPRAVPILRTEVYLTRQQNQAATRQLTPDRLEDLLLGKKQEASPTCRAPS